MVRSHRRPPLFPDVGRFQTGDVNRVHSSEVERLLDAQEVIGSKPFGRTTIHDVEGFNDLRHNHMPA